MGAQSGWRISRGLPAAKAVPDTPLVAVRATPVRLSLRYSTYIRLKTLVHPGYLSIPYSLHPFRTRQDGRAMHRISAEGANSRCTACTAHLPISFYYCAKSTAAINPRTLRCSQIEDALGANSIGARQHSAMYALLDERFRGGGDMISKCFTIHMISFWFIS